MSKLYHINEDDLAELEQTLPSIMWMFATTCNDIVVWHQWNRVKEIVSHVRWGYGPPQSVENVPAGNDR